ncbi:MAG: DUF2905 domain-containing protein [Proteobacteria bacterium]|nr:DUF2905 domain-containing protein [Pseudomonadota bacterium]
MDNLGGLGKFLILAGLLLIFIGIIVYLSGKIPFLGKLPGDIYIKRDNFTFYFPVVTMIIISLILTIIMNIFFRK